MPRKGLFLETSRTVEAFLLTLICSSEYFLVSGVRS